MISSLGVCSVFLAFLVTQTPSSLQPATSQPATSQPAASQHTAPTPKPRLAVLDFKTDGKVEASGSGAIADAVRDEFHRCRQYDLMDRQMMRERMGEKDWAESVECDEIKCLVRCGTSLDVQKIVGGLVTSFGETWVLTIRLVDVGTGREEKLFTRKHDGKMSELLDIARDGAREIIGLPITAGPPTFTNSIGIRLVLIPAGTFQMGGEFSPDEVVQRFGGKADAFEAERPQHTVVIAESFYLGVTEVTVEQFRRFVDATSYVTEAKKTGKPGGLSLRSDRSWGWNEDADWQNPGFPQTDVHPVVMVTWNDAKAFCAWLSDKEKKQYRLPTEGEWEYACRAGTQTAFWWGNEMDSTGNVENTMDTKHGTPPSPIKAMPCDDGYFATAPVADYRANVFGLHDMGGNALEWCASRYEAYPGSTAPSASFDRRSKVVRGGSWNSDAARCRSAFRFGSTPSARSGNLGFRVAVGAQ